MYATVNFPSKKALKEAVAAGKRIGVYEPGIRTIADPTTFTGRATLEGPWCPQPHKWYAQVKVVDGAITEVK